MQISRRILLACLTTTILIPNFTQAADSEAQKKARQALEQALKQTESASPAPAVQTPAQRPGRPAPSEPKFEALPAAPAKAAPAQPSAASATATPERANGAFFEPVPTTQSNSNLEKAEQALREAMARLASQPETAAPTVESAPSKAPVASDKPEKVEKAKSASSSTAELTFTPIQGPSSGLPAEKEAKLKALLDLYVADQVTPTQYHEQRAKILAEP